MVRTIDISPNEYRRSVVLLGYVAALVLLLVVAGAELALVAPFAAIVVLWLVLLARRLQPAASPVEAPRSWAWAAGTMLRDVLAVYGAIRLIMLFL